MIELTGGSPVPMLQSVFNLFTTADANLLEAVRLSLLVSITATILAACLAIPLGAWLALASFRGRSLVVVILNSLMGLPPVVVGLLVYLLLSRVGPLGRFGLLFTPPAMVLAQAILVAPIIAALTRQTIADLWSEYRDEFEAVRIGSVARVRALLWEGRFSLVTALLAGFGRAIAEVGAVIIVGGNIAGFTRTMTTTIALETSKGDLNRAVALGIVLIGIVMVINGFVWMTRRAAERLAA